MVGLYCESPFQLTLSQGQALLQVLNLDFIVIYLHLWYDAFFEKQSVVIDTQDLQRRKVLQFNRAFDLPQDQLLDKREVDQN